MTERKPPGLPWESWIDRQIREAEERGAFRDLPGAGKPIPDLDRPYDELWWVRQKLRREGVSCLPPGLRLRKRVEDFFDRLAEAPSESAVVRRVGELNTDIRKVNAAVASGPPSGVRPLDPDRVLARWRELRAAGPGHG